MSASAIPLVEAESLPSPCLGDGGRAATGRAAPGPRRILFVDHTARLGGGEIALLNLVRHLDRRRYEPVVVLLSDGPLIGRLAAEGVETHLLPAPAGVVDTRKGALGGQTLLRFGAGLSLLRVVWRLSRLIRRTGADLVHTNSLKADVIGGLAGRLARRPVVWHVRDRIADDYLPPRVAAAFRWLARRLPRFIIANSAATLRTLETTPRAGAAGAVPSAVVPSGVTFRARAGIVHDGTPVRSDAPAPGVPGCPAPEGARPPVVGLVGRISPWKGQHVFLRAAALVRRQFPDACFQIIGAALFEEQAYEREVRALADAPDLAGSVHFTGFRDDVSEAINGLDVLAHASVTGEPFGQVVIEGMAAGKAVVATDGGGIPEIVVDGVTGLLVPMGDAEAMAAAIARLLADPDARRRMGREGRERVRKHFTIERTAGEVAAVYDTILSAPTGAGCAARLPLPKLRERAG